MLSSKHFRFLAVLAFVSFAHTSFANCGVSPFSPTSIDTNQLYLEQLQSISDEMEAYDVVVRQHQDCIEAAIVALVPPTGDHPDEYYASDEYLNSAEYLAYQSQFNALQAQFDAAQSERDTAFETFDALAVNAVPQPDE